MRSTVRGAVVATVLLACLAVAGPALADPKDLRVSTATCDGVTVVGDGLPRDQELFLLVRNLANGATVGGKPKPVRTEAAGTLEASVNVDLSAVRTVDVSVWTKKGETLQMAARDVAATSCGRLPMTGTALTGRLLPFAAALLALGAVLLWRARRRAA